MTGLDSDPTDTNFQPFPSTSQPRDGVLNVSREGPCLGRVLLTFSYRPTGSRFKFFNKSVLGYIHFRESHYLEGTQVADMVFESYLQHYPWWLPVDMEVSDLNGVTYSFSPEVLAHREEVELRLRNVRLPSLQNLLSYSLPHSGFAPTTNSCSSTRTSANASLFLKRRSGKNSAAWITPTLDLCPSEKSKRPTLGLTTNIIGSAKISVTEPLVLAWRMGRGTSFVGRIMNSRLRPPNCHVVESVKLLW